VRLEINPVSAFNIGHDSSALTYSYLGKFITIAAALHCDVNITGKRQCNCNNVSTINYSYLFVACEVSRLGNAFQGTLTCFNIFISESAAPENVSTSSDMWSLD
jgi:hypothetical protein